MSLEQLTKKNKKELERFFKNKKVLVCGGAGFIGTNLLLAFLEVGVRPNATYHIKKPQIIDKRITFVKADLSNAKDCEKVVKGVDYVFMCAANTSGAAVIEKTPLAHVTPNVVMNALTLEAAYNAGVKKFLFVSSNTVYPPFNHPVKEHETYKGEPFYKYFPVAWMKRYGEILCEIYSSKINKPMTCVVVRPANVYGPYDDFAWETSHVIPALIRKVVERHNPVEVWGDGKEIKDLIFVDDFIEGMIKAFVKIKDFKPVNIGSGSSVSINKVLGEIIKVEGFDGAYIKHNISKPTMIKKRQLDISLAKRYLKFTPSTLLYDGLKKTINWYKQNGYVG